MYGTLKIFMYVTIPNMSDVNEYEEKKVCIARRHVLRDHCEEYIAMFKHENNLDRNTVSAEWTATERILA